MQDHPVGHDRGELWHSFTLIRALGTLNSGGGQKPQERGRHVLEIGSLSVLDQYWWVLGWEIWSNHESSLPSSGFKEDFGYRPLNLGAIPRETLVQRQY